MTNEALIEMFRQHLIDSFSNRKPDSAYKQKIKEYHDAVAIEFEKEWNKKKLKFLFKKKRQEKLRKQIALKLIHLSPLFYLVECVVEETLPKSCKNNDEWFTEIVSFN